MSLIKNELKKANIAINARLKDLLDQSNCQLCSAMRYSCLPAGKCIRGFLVIEFCKLFNINQDDAVLLACVIELLHTFSLVHDDLPALDNSDTRRFKKSCHIVFGESTAILAGDAILVLGYQILGKHFPHASSFVSKYLMQMIKGQSEELTEKEQDWYSVASKKTGSMFALSCALAPFVSGADQSTIAAAEKFGSGFGILFQLIDDIKDGDCKNLPDKSQIKKLQDKLESEISKIVVEQRRHTFFDLIKLLQIGLD